MGAALAPNPRWPPFSAPAPPSRPHPRLCPLLCWKWHLWREAERVTGSETAHGLPGRGQADALARRPPPEVPWGCRAPSGQWGLGRLSTRQPWARGRDTWQTDRHITKDRRMVRGAAPGSFPAVGTPGSTSTWACVPGRRPLRQGRTEHLQQVYVSVWPASPSWPQWGGGGDRGRVGGGGRSDSPHPALSPAPSQRCALGWRLQR